MKAKSESEVAQSLSLNCKFKCYFLELSERKCFFFFQIFFNMVESLEMEPRNTEGRLY